MIHLEPLLYTRLGGDEFAIFSPEPDTDEIFLTTTIHRTAVPLPDGSAVTLSIGLAKVRHIHAERAARSTSELIDDLQDQADRALKSSKLAGRSRTTAHGR